jgi:hypothetical protein
MVVAVHAGSRKRILMKSRGKRFLDVGTDQTDEHPSHGALTLRANGRAGKSWQRR